MVFVGARVQLYRTFYYNDETSVEECEVTTISENLNAARRSRLGELLTLSEAQKVLAKLVKAGIDCC